MKYKEFHRFVQAEGWSVVRQTGSHRVYEKSGHPRKLIIPYHSGEMPEPLRRSILREMGLQ